MPEDQAHGSRNDVQAYHDQGDEFGDQGLVRERGNGEVGREYEEQQHHKEHTQHHRREAQKGSSRLASAGPRCAAKPFVGQEGYDEYEGEHAHQVHEEGVVPSESAEKAAEEGGDHAAHLVHEGREAHEPSLLLRREVVRKKARGERHDHAYAHAQQRAHDEDEPYVVDEKCSGAEAYVHQQPDYRQGPGFHEAAYGWEEEVGEDDEESRQADYELDHEAALIAEVLPDDAQGRGHGGARHYGEKGDGEDGEGEFTRVFLIHCFFVLLIIGVSALPGGETIQLPTIHDESWAKTSVCGCKNKKKLFGL